MSRLPALFVGHGAPTLALDAQKGAPFRALGETLAGVRSVLVVSAHWEASPATLGAVEARALIYDFYGFPPELYAVKYAPPGAPELAGRVSALLGGEMRRAPQRGLDHGVWTPLVHLFPRADRPVLEISLPSALGAEAVFDLGRKLAPLRDEGVLLVGSGNITHNLRAMAPEGTPPEPEYVAFDAWVAERLLSHDTAALVAAPRTAPGFRRNHPTLDHWLPLLFPLGAAAADDAVRFPVTGWEYGNLSRRAVLFG